MISTPSLVVSAGVLRPALAALAKVVKKGPAVPEPLRHLKVETVSRTTLRFTASDGEVFFSIDLPAEVGENTGTFLVPLDRLQTELRGARAQDAIPVRPGKAPSASAYPEPPMIRSNPIELAPFAVTVLRQALACSSTDLTRHILQGAFLDPSGKEGVRIVGTDGRLLFRSRPLPITGLREGLVLPALPVLDSPLLREPGPWRLHLPGPREKDHPEGFRLDGGSWCLTGRRIEGSYPSHGQVIPRESEVKVRLNLPEVLRDPLLHLLERLPGRDLRNRPLGIRLDREGVSLLARETTEDDYEQVRLPRAEGAGENLTTFVNRDYLARALRCGMTRLEIIDEISPVRCLGETGLMIVMPVRAVGEVRIGESRVLPLLEGRHLPSPRRVVRPGPAGPAPAKPVPAVIPIPVKPPSRKREPRTRPESEAAPPPLATAAEAVTEIQSALKAARAKLSQLTAFLRLSRRQQRETEREVRTARKALRTLRPVEP
jgi:DNA polymerase III sliding clamp (beta) subunit (PCNA family)